MTTVNDVIRQVQQQLHQAGIDSPAAEAAIIVSHVVGVSRGELGVMKILGQHLSPDVVEKIAHLAQARTTRVPLQHLTGETTFYGVDLKIEPGVFIPRVETEVLVETTLQHFAGTSRPLRIMDLCTGSGAIAAALADQFAQQNITTSIWAVDSNPIAAQLAHHNTSDYKVTVLCADATDGDSLVAQDAALVDLRGMFDAVVSNPPYIPSLTPVTQIEAEHDPALALYGGSADGLSIPLRIADQAANWLAPGGLFIMEHDHSHAAQLAATLSRKSWWHRVQTLQDLTKTDRFVSALRAELTQPTLKPLPTLAQ